MEIQFALLMYNLYLINHFDTRGNNIFEKNKKDVNQKKIVSLKRSAATWIFWNRNRQTFVSGCFIIKPA